MKILGLRAEALLKLNRHEEAIETMDKVSNFEIDHCLKFFGPVGSSSLLIFCAQVDLVAGRLELRQCGSIFINTHFSMNMNMVNFIYCSTYISVNDFEKNNT